MRRPTHLVRMVHGRHPPANHSEVIDVLHVGAYPSPVLTHKSPILQSLDRHFSNNKALPQLAAFVHYMNALLKFYVWWNNRYDLADS